MFHIRAYDINGKLIKSTKDSVDLWPLFDEYLTAVELDKMNQIEWVRIDQKTFVHWTSDAVREIARMLDYILIKDNDLDPQQSLQSLMFNSMEIPHSESMQHAESMLYLRMIAGNQEWDYLEVLYDFDD